MGQKRDRSFCYHRPTRGRPLGRRIKSTLIHVLIGWRPVAGAYGRRRSGRRRSISRLCPAGRRPRRQPLKAARSRVNSPPMSADVATATARGWPPSSWRMTSTTRPTVTNWWGRKEKAVMTSSRRYDVKRTSENYVTLWFRFYGHN